MAPGPTSAPSPGKEADHSGLTTVGIISIAGVMLGAALGIAGYVYKHREHKAIMELATQQKIRGNNSNGDVQALAHMSKGQTTIGAAGSEAVMSGMKKIMSGKREVATSTPVQDPQEKADAIERVSV
jgi:hypothetical protein